VPQIDGDARRLGVDADYGFDADAVGRCPGEWVVHVLGHGGSCRQLADRRDHARFAIVEPSPLQGVKPVPSVFHPELKNFALGDPRGAEGCQIVVPPLLGHSYAHLAKPHDVHHMLIVLLNFRRGKDRSALSVDVARRSHIRRG
jgi:hypothetical protein